MAAGIVLPSQGERFNTETNTDPRVTKIIAFDALGMKFSCELKIPVYIWDKLTSEDWDYVEPKIREYAMELRRQMVLLGSTDIGKQVAFHVDTFARRAIYNQFMKYQVKAGNHEGHEVPEGLG